MSPTLRALIVSTGLVLGGFVVYLAASGSDPVVIKTQALADGFVARVAEADFHILPAGIAWLADAGKTAPKYVRLQFPIGLGVGKESHVCTGVRFDDGGSTGELNPDGGTECSDGGNVVILPDLPLDKLTRVQDSAITIDTCANRPNVCPLYGSDRPFLVVGYAGLTPAQVCAWKPDVGAVCGRINPDGGVPLDPGVQNTMQPGQWVGADCQKKSCVEIAGDPSNP